MRPLAPTSTRPSRSHTLDALKRINCPPVTVAEINQTRAPKTALDSPSPDSTKSGAARKALDQTYNQTAPESLAKPARRGYRRHT